MSGFNTSTRRSEDTSTKLKAQNLRNAKDQSRRLEEENIRMEDRLRELKLAMSREKEERERKGGGFWSKGQTGTLNNYATEVLEKQRSKKKEKVIKILKDEPIILPERSSQPGTMKYIAQRPLDGKENKPKFLKCGQCEDRTASLSCLQCSEHYCTRCFAAFHIKGALKKHRSVPISATGPRLNMSPRPLNSYRSMKSDSPHSVVGAMSSSNNYEGSDRNGPEGVSGSFDGPSLMSGQQYNETQSAASFQQALVAWRASDNSHSPRRKILGTKKPSPRTIVVSPVKSPVFSTESSTSTVVVPVSPDIHFHSSISYAERLLLKNHRRTDVPTLQSSGSVTPINDRMPKYSRDGSRYDDLEDEAVDFKALYEASIVSGQSPQQDPRTESSISIIEIDSSSSKRDPSSMEYSDKYRVQEVDPYEAWEVENLRKSLAAVKSPREAFTDEKPPRHSTKMQQSKSAKSSERDVAISSFMSDSDLQASDTRRKKYKPDSKRRNTHTDANGGDGETNMDFVYTNEMEPELDFGESIRPKSRPVSSRSRPASVRAKSAKSRAASRAASRTKAVREGLLTKVPSESLREIASRLGQTEMFNYKSPMEEFFTMGVKSKFQERSVTPSSKKSKERSWRVSNKLYQMSPRSWRPENSLEDTLPSDEVYMEDHDVLLGYMLSDETDGSVEFQPADAGDSRMSSRNEKTPTNEAPVWKVPSPVSRQNTRHSQILASKTPELSRENTQHSENVLSNTPEPYRQDTQHSQRFISNSPELSREDSRHSQRFASKTPLALREDSFHSRKLPRMTPEPKMTPRQSSSRPMSKQETRPASRAIVVDGEDMSKYDEADCIDLQDHDDNETLDQLEWELASQSGRLTADGQISRMSVPDEDLSGSKGSRSLTPAGLRRADQSYDIGSKLRADELSDETDENDNVIIDTEDVRALH